MFIKSLLPRDRADGAYDDEYDGDDVLGKVVTQWQGRWSVPVNHMERLAPQLAAKFTEN